MAAKGSAALGWLDPLVKEPKASAGADAPDDAAVSFGPLVKAPKPSLAAPPNGSVEAMGAGCAGVTWDRPRMSSIGLMAVVVGGATCTCAPMKLPKGSDVSAALGLSSAKSPMSFVAAVIVVTHDKSCKRRAPPKR